MRAMAVSDDDVRAVQAAYPRIYFACHTRHVRRRSSAAGLSPADATVLQHLGPRPGPTLGELARHLGVGKPTLSAALKRLEGLGVVQRTVAAADRRVVRLSLTERGISLTRSVSVLDAGRVAAVLARLRPAQRRRAIEGLELLALAAARAPRSSSALSGGAS